MKQNCWLCNYEIYFKLKISAVCDNCNTVFCFRHFNRGFKTNFDYCTYIYDDNNLFVRVKAEPNYNKNGFDVTIKSVLLSGLSEIMFVEKQKFNKQYIEKIIKTLSIS